jgi:hypothetical protein
VRRMMSSISGGLSNPILNDMPAPAARPIAHFSARRSYFTAFFGNCIRKA